MSGIYGLVGRKLSHSWSEMLHAELNNPGYRLIELEPEELSRFFSDPQLAGVNVTIPYKRAVLPFIDETDPAAQAVGNVNTVVRGRDGRLIGYNTDLCGLQYMAARAGIGMSGKKVLIFGSGGASLTAQAAAKEAGAKSVTVISRSGADNYDNLYLHRDAQILVNATPVGMFPGNGQMPADPALFPGCEGVLDLIYNPLRTAFLMRAEELQIPCSNGLPMMAEQARAAEEFFFGKKIDASETERILSLVCGRMENIVLIGMPGSGKSTVGRLLGKICGRRVIDSDEEIVREAGMSIPELFEKNGEPAFRAMERACIERLGKMSGLVIVTGGGAVTEAANYPSLHQNGRIYELIRPLGSLARKGRPLSQNGDIAELYKNRATMYARFRDAAIKNDRRPEDAAEDILKDIQSRQGQGHKVKGIRSRAMS